MDRQVKAISIILYVLWPFSAVVIGLRNFDSAFGRKLLIAAFAFLGYTAIDSGDLERYATVYYEATNDQLGYLFDMFLNLKAGKFFTDFTAMLFSVFDNHHIYFAFLFGFYGYFLVGAVNLLRIKVLKKSSFPVLIGFVTFAFFYSILTVFNYAFYTGGIYFLYFLLQIILNENTKKYFLLIFVTPLFHIGLTPLLLVPMFFVLFRQRTNLYILLLITFTILSQTFLLTNVQTKLQDSDTVFEEKFRAYGSEKGMERMDNRYAEGYQTGNSNYRLFKDIREITNKLIIPLLLFVLYMNRKKYHDDKTLLDLLNLSIACMAITNLMLNISQGERFYFFSGFMVLATYIYFLQKINYSALKFKPLMYLLIPCLLLNNLVSLILVKNLISVNFWFSNFTFELFSIL
ncbi:EpsG family protein [Gelidibacter maritimus]|uniref:EpsG family protein n=1 Tax=Gelidibacter maritimus TaxID=2761487 RepID=A0A7W2M636_9FLAO|nr:EpsG family protein [Gelidibacter maritimus]MBA6153398.1 EpsG family protein [Gelidibacter maritimus]